MTLDEYLQEVKTEVERATKLYGPFNSPHEGYGVILEELDEMWDEVKANDNAKARTEAVQTAAMLIRFLLDSEKWSER